MKVSAFLTAALAELNIQQAGAAPSGEDLDFALLIYNELLDAWNADGRAIYTSSFPTPFTITPNLNPHTIGLTANSPTWTVTINRPQRIYGASLILNTTTPNTYLPMTPRDRNWWQNLRVPGVTSAIPTDFYYEPDWPNGSFYFWPVPTTAYTVQLALETLLAQVVLTDTFTLPPGYQAALRLTVAEACVPAFAVPMPPTLPQRAMEARARIWGQNRDVPKLATATSGFQSGSAQRGTYNYLTGQVN